MQNLARPFEDVLITEVVDGPFFVDDLFRRKFGHPAPEYGRHLVCFYRQSSDCHIPLCYVHYSPYEGVLLVGGGMTDGRVFQHMPAQLSQNISDSGGIFYYVLMFGWTHFAEDCEAFFGYAGDPRAYEVDIAAGFEPTQHQYLIAHFHIAITEERKEALISKIHAIGTF